MRRLLLWKLGKSNGSKSLVARFLVFWSLAALSPGALSEDLVLSSAPPYFVPSAEPNLIVSLEYSGAMHSGHLPWNLNTDEYFRVTPMATASGVNTLYYDPQINYLPPIDANGNQMDHGVFGAALRSVFIEGDESCSLDLSQHYEAVLVEQPPVCEEANRQLILWDSVYAHNTGNPAYSAGTNPNEWPYACMYGPGGCPAYYNVFRPDPHDDSCKHVELSEFDVAGLTRQWEAVGVATDPGEALTRYADELAGWSPCFKTFYVGSDLSDGDPGYLTSSELARRRALLQEEAEDGLSAEVLARRNFANWYSYHRTVGRTAKAALSRSMAPLGSNVRVTYQPDVHSLHANLATFSGSGRTAFYDWLFALDPLSTAVASHVSAMLDAGAFASTESAYRANLDAQLDTDNPALSCRNNLYLLLAASPGREQIEPGAAQPPDCRPLVNPPAWLGNNDGTPATLPENACNDGSSCQVYDGRPPFGDRNSGTLADIALHYWSTDLLPGLSNNVPALITDATGESTADNFWNADNDLATWQHMTTFSVGMDLRGSVMQSSGEYVHGTGTRNITDDGFPGAVDTMDQCSTDWGSELNLDDIWHAGVNGRGGYTSATNASDLLAGLVAVTHEAAEAAGSRSASSEAISTGVLFNGDKVYQSVMSPLDWSGDLRIAQISHGLGEEPCPLKKLGELCQDVAAGQEPYRSAAEELAGQDWDAGRKILTRNRTQEFAFRSDDDHWGRLTDDQQDALTSGGTVSEEEAKARIDFLRGDRSNEAGESGTYSFRNRGSLLGDILGSTPPVVVGAPYRFYQDHGYLEAAEPNGASFRDAHASRADVVYVGANDGLLHAFDANLGTELFAYVPRMIFDGLADLTMSGYGSIPAHRNFVDGAIVEGDVYFAGQWHTVLAVSAGLGAQGLFALDVTNPGGVVEQTVELDSPLRDSLSLWELTDDPDPNDTGTDDPDRGDPDIGYILGRPSIVRIPGTMVADAAAPQADPRWTVVFGNGYNSSQADGHRSVLCDQEPVGDLCGEAVLFVRGIADGRAVARYETGKGQAADPLKEADEVGRANGLAQPTVVDYDGDLTADAAYAGDLFGNLWRFDLTNSTSNPTLLFSATDGSGLAQSITTPPAVLRHPLGIGVLVIFGTGQLLQGSDVSDTQIQAVYAIWDDIDSQGAHYCSNRPETLTRAHLLRQHIIVPAARVGTVSNARVVSNTSIDWAVSPENRACGGHWGWYLDLVSTEVSGNEVTQITDGATVGERIIGAPELDFNRLIFTTVTPSADRCAAGGSSWVNMLDARNGSRTEAATFDLDLDGSIGISDLIDVADSTGPVPASGMQLVTAGSQAGSIYRSAASLALEAGQEIKGLTTGEGSPTADEAFRKWRVWRRIR